MRFNLYYFGLEGIHCYALISKSVIYGSVRGSVELDKKFFGAIQIGFASVNIFDSKFERSVWSNSGNIVFHGKVFLGQGTRITNSGNLEFGENTVITANTSLVCAKHIAFGSENQVSWDCLIMDTDLHPIFQKEEENKQLNYPQDIIFGDKVWIGCRSTILKGTTVKSGCIVAAGSLLANQKCEVENSIVSSQKRVIKKDIVWSR